MASTSSIHRHPSDRNAKAGYSGGVSGAIGRLWNHPLRAALVAAGVAALAGIAMALIMPRGPVDSETALLLLFASLLTGAAAGFTMHSGWAALLAPLTFLLVFEMGRRAEAGPSVDGIRFDSIFGILGLLVGRGVFVLVGLVPMAVGAAYGVVLANRVRRSQAPSGKHPIPAAGRWRTVLLGVATVGIAVLALAIAWPASVPPVTDANGNPIQGSIASLEPVELGGYQQWIEVRGASADNPIILYLNGGPGQSDLALSRTLLEPLHDDFTVIGWDQRGAGKSYAALDPDTLTLQSVVDDTIELTNYLRERFDQEKIYLLTESWGSIPGILAVQQHPELYHAYIGSGQMVDIQETDRIIYDDMLAAAEASGDPELEAELRDYGPPPYGTIWANALVAQNYDSIEDDYDPPQAYIDRGEAAGVGFFGIMGSEYTLIDKANVLRGLLDMASVMYPQLQEIDFREQATRLDVPVYIFEGEHELRGRQEVLHAWFELLDAPVKKMYTFADAGHAPAFEHADDLHRILIEEIVPQATAI